MLAHGTVKLKDGRNRNTLQANKIMRARRLARKTASDDIKEAYNFYSKLKRTASLQ